MKQYLITKVYTSDKNKDGKEFISKNGKKFWKIAIKTDRTGDEWYSTLAFSPDAPELKLQEGDEKVLVLEEKDGYKNFRLPSTEDLHEERLLALERAVKQIQDKLFPKAGVSVDSPVEYPDDEIPEGDIPF